MKGRLGNALLGLATVAVTTIALGIGAVSASAATVQWNPQNTVEPSQLASGTSLVMTDNLGMQVVCNTVTSNTKAPINGNPATSGSVDSNGAAAPPQFSNCTNTLLPGNSTTVTGSGQWLFTATSTSSVDSSQASATINIGGGVCVITVSNASITGNTWSNTSHQLTTNSSASFPISESGLCDGATSSTLKGTLQSPSTVTIS